MKIHPKQKISVINHIHEFWQRGCKCVVCQAVDNREDLKLKN